MSDPNKNITEYLELYIHDESTSSPLAILIKGGWGSGKSWYVKKFMDDFEKNKKLRKEEYESKFIYISIYGLGSTAEIDALIFRAIYPLLNTKTVKVAAGVVKYLMRFKGVGVPEIKPLDFMEKFKDKVLVIDDLERSNIPLEEVFGYINSYVEHESKKVIIIANDDEIETDLPDEKKKEKSKYHRIREKIIGKSFKVKTDVPTVIDSLIEANSLPCNDFLLSKRDLLITIFKVVQKENSQTNYRAFSHVIKDFAYLWEKLDQKHKECDELMTEFLNCFVRLAYELQLGNITAENILSIEAFENEQAMNRIRQSNAGLKEKEVTQYQTIEAFLTRHSLQGGNSALYKDLSNGNMVLYCNVWVQILCEANMNLTLLREGFDYSRYFKDETLEDWLSLWGFYDLEDTKALELVKTIVNNLNNRTYEDIGVIFHIYGSLCNHPL